MLTCAISLSQTHSYFFGCFRCSSSSRIEKTSSVQQGETESNLNDNICYTNAYASALGVSVFWITKIYERKIDIEWVFFFFSIQKPFRKRIHNNHETVARVKEETQLSVCIEW